MTTGSNDSPGNDGGLLSRWAARKEAVARAEAAEAEAEAEARSAEEGREAREAEEDANRLAAEAIDLEAATYETDFTPFLKQGVPAALRHKALQTLWRSNPTLAVLDGLNDYDEDYRTVKTISGAVKSTWEAGRGYAAKADDVRREMEEREETLRKAATAKADAEAAESESRQTADPMSGDPQALAEADPEDGPVRDGSSEDRSPDPEAGSRTEAASDEDRQNFQSPAERLAPVRVSLRSRLLDGGN